jgi:O-methyltransferase
MLKKWLYIHSEDLKGIALNCVMNILYPIRGALITYAGKDQRSIYDFIRKIKNERRVLMWPNEGYQLYTTARATGKIPGDMAEVGVFQGGSARILCEVKGKRALHLFDTFEGLPETSIYNEDHMYKGEFATSLDGVKAYLRSFKNVYFYKGIFPKSSGPIKQKKFSFVNLDVDLYEGTRDALAFFYPRMSAGGIIMTHNYGNLSGVKRAFDEFFKTKQEPVIELAASQCLVVKT